MSDTSTNVTQRGNFTSFKLQFVICQGDKIKTIVRLGQGQAKAKPKAITEFTLNYPPTTQTFQALPGKLERGFSV